MASKEERTIDGVKLVGWPAIIVKRLEDVEVEVKDFLSQLSGVEQELTGLKEKLIKIIKMSK